MSPPTQRWQSQRDRPHLQHPPQSTGAPSPEAVPRLVPCFLYSCIHFVRPGFAASAAIQGVDVLHEAAVSAVQLGLNGIAVDPLKSEATVRGNLSDTPCCGCSPPQAIYAASGAPVLTHRLSPAHTRAPDFRCCDRETNQRLLARLVAPATSAFHNPKVSGQSPWPSISQPGSSHNG